jgi:hypothetical protein
MARKPRTSRALSVQRHPELLDKHLLLKHYRSETIGGSEARQRWVAPDLRELPVCPSERT